MKVIIKIYFSVYTCNECGYHSAGMPNNCANCGLDNIWVGNR